MYNWLEVILYSLQWIVDFACRNWLEVIQYTVYNKKFISSAIDYILY